MSIKTSLKRVPAIRKVLEYRNKKRSSNRIKKNLDEFCNRFINESTDPRVATDQYLLRRKIIIDSHIIEKGLSHSDYRAGFGKAVVQDLQTCLKLYMETEHPDKFAVSNAEALLYSYHVLNKNNGYDDSNYLNISLIKNSNSLLSKDYSCGSFDLDSAFVDLALNRRSVREYEDEGLPIERDLLERVIELANTAPSACNRQATHVFSIQDKEVMKKVEQIHGGCKGFGSTASLMLFVTSDLTLYSSNEVKMPMYDAGIYTMNLLYALEVNKLSTCVLNGSFPGSSSKKIHEVTSIPDRYDINGVIIVYKCSEDKTVKVAQSPRRSSSDVLTVI